MAADFAGPFGAFSFLPDPDTLRMLLEKARWVRGFKYRRWLEDDVPRASLRIQWAAP
jgi:hypothetical protein